MLIPCISKPPALLKLSDKTLNRLIDNTRLMTDPTARRRRRNGPDLTAQPGWMCTSCKAGKHVCYSRRCSCKYCETAV